MIFDLRRALRSCLFQVIFRFATVLDARLNPSDKWAEHGGHCRELRSGAGLFEAVTRQSPEKPSAYDFHIVPLNFHTQAVIAHILGTRAEKWLGGREVLCGLSVAFPTFARSPVVLKDHRGDIRLPQRLHNVNVRRPASLHFLDASSTKLFHAVQLPHVSLVVLCHCALLPGVPKVTRLLRGVLGACLVWRHRQAVTPAESLIARGSIWDGGVEILGGKTLPLLECRIVRV